MKSATLPVIFIMGPTASGKTQLAMSLADNYPVELVSVDSALIYKGMDIGTAKPTPAELVAYPHHLVDIKDPTETYSAAEFTADVLALIKAIHARGKVPLLVGGTMLYFKALLEGLSPLPEADAELRLKIENDAAVYGWSILHQRLQVLDPISAARIHENDSQRISRALEVFLLTGRPLSDLHKEKGEAFPYPCLQYSLLPVDRAWLHQRIEQRFEIMLNAGFLNEVQALIDRGDLNLNMPSMRCVGYRQAWEHLHSEYDEEELIFRGVSATRQLAKRQITWLRSWQGALNVNCEDSTLLLDEIRRHIDNSLLLP